MNTTTQDTTLETLIKELNAVEGDIHGFLWADRMETEAYMRQLMKAHDLTMAQAADTIGEYRSRGRYVRLLVRREELKRKIAIRTAARAFTDLAKS
jgi:hypothetical protein